MAADEKAPVEAPRLKGADVVWNAVSLGVFVLGALAANLMIARFYGPAPTGLFNQTLAFFIVGGQFAVFGLHQTALREASLCSRDDAPALLVTLLGALVRPALLTTVCGAALSFVVPYMFKSEGLDTALRLALLGLPSFALNKILINLASGLGFYRVFGLSQAARSLLFAGFCLVWGLLGWNGERIALALAASEIVLSLALLLFMVRKVGLSGYTPGKFDPGALRAFGARIVPSVALAELNTRVDVLVLGLFAGASEVGVYSIAAWIIEGALQLPAAVRPMINTRMARLLAAQDYAGLRQFVFRVGSLVLAAMACGLAAVLVLYPLFGAQVLKDARYDAAFWPLLWLCAGAVAMSWASPFDMMLVQAGHLRAQLMLRAGVMAVNLLLAVPGAAFFGAVGVAAAYGASLASYGVLLRLLVRRFIGPAIG